jgi:hypothetical protein
LNKKVARRIVMAAGVTTKADPSYLRNTGAAHEASAPRQRAGIWEIKKMRKTILTVVGAALIAASAVSTASAAERHQRYHRAPVGLSDQVRNSNAYVAPTVAVQPEWPGYGYGDGYYSHGFSAPAGR